MSRSYKKTPIVKDNIKTRKYYKRQANKLIRRSPLVFDGNYYRKIYNSWDIYDYVNYCTFEEYMSSSHLLSYCGSEEEQKQSWRRCFYLK